MNVFKVDLFVLSGSYLYGIFLKENGNEMKKEMFMIEN